MTDNINKFQAKCPLPVTVVGGFSFDTTECAWPGSVKMEEWRNVDSLNGRYQISNRGKLRRVNKDPRSCKHKLIKGQIDRYGYLIAYLTRTYRKSFHRIVALHFIDNPYNLPCINHIDGNKQNNNMNNIEWCTHAYNTWHMKNVLHKWGGSHKKIINKTTGEKYNSIKEAALKHGLNYKSLANRIKLRPHLTEFRYG